MVEKSRFITYNKLKISIQKGPTIMMKVLMICHGNICRSTMAEFVLKNLVRNAHLEDCFEIASAGTSREEIGNDTHYGTKRKLDEMNIPYTHRKARQVTRQDYAYYDYLICMDYHNLRNLNRIIGNDTEHKVSILLDFTKRKGADIADPWYTGNFDATYHDVLEGCAGFLETISIK